MSARRVQRVEVAAVLVAGLCLLVLVADAATIHRRRAVSSESTTNSVKPPCQGRTPCGWAVYKPFTRRFDYYMENTCECPPTKACLRTDDDLSVSAYVYTCRTEAGEEDAQSLRPPATSIAHR